MVKQVAELRFGLQRFRDPHIANAFGGPNDVVQRDRTTCEPNEEDGALLFRRHSATSRITSSSTGMPNGKLATPSTMRTDVLSFPKMLSNSSDAASATFG